MHVPDRLKAAADVGLGGVFAGAVAFQAWEVAGSWGHGYWLSGALVGAVVCVLALVRHRNPLWTAAAGLTVAGLAVPIAHLLGLPAEPGPAASLGLAVLTGSAVRTLPVRAAGAVAAAGPAVVAGSFVAGNGSGVPVLAGVAWLGGMASGLGRRLLTARRRAAAERLRRAERLELARELHDVVAHHVTSIVLQAQAGRLVTRKHPDRAPASFADIETAGSEALAATRRLVGLLRDTTPVPDGRVRLSELIEGFESHGRRARLRLDADPSSWPPEVSGTVYRVVRESLTNVLRHAGNSRLVTIGVTQERDTVTVVVEDDAPQTAAHQAGYGLNGMRERLDALGGSLSAGPRPEYGWSIRATIPMGRRGRR
ncbi:sensor histidine kinase [Sinosporangium siamense]|uniref:sensor histidine kinase n=1 Tax=Sinosporangium siamense TaxID=1367973 RepID=UPI001EF350BC|nr:histidine kinase [Sinosporangium siamense]